MHPNEALLRESYEALERGDWDSVRNTLAEDFVLAVAGRNPRLGVVRPG
jgi:ketosteroid isomerase-like protein